MSNGLEGIMRMRMQRLALLGMLMGGLMSSGLAPAHAAGTTQIGGDATIDAAGPCGTPQPGFPDYAGLALTGDLVGCWYTHVDTIKTTPSGGYHETGREMFVGSYKGGPVGTFTTTYVFTAKYAPDGVTEIFGRCHHPIVAGSGTGGFTGVAGRVDFKDIIGDPV